MVQYKAHWHCTYLVRIGRQYSFSFSSQIRASLADLKKESGLLQEVWEEQRQRLDQMLQLQHFLRDAKIVVSIFLPF